MSYKDYQYFQCTLLSVLLFIFGYVPLIMNTVDTYYNSNYADLKIFSFFILYTFLYLLIVGVNITITNLLVRDDLEYLEDS